jgi:HD-like signal output (HDOD) protein
VAALVYYLSAIHAATPRPKKKTTAEISEEQAREIALGPKAPSSIERSPLESSIVYTEKEELEAGPEEKTVEKIEASEDQDDDLKSLFLPSEQGIYHYTDYLTDRGWADLEYTLQTLSRLPAAAAELLEVLNSPDSSASDVAHIAEQNIALAARILKLVNSPFYGLNKQVDDIQHAVALLGFNEIYQVIITSSIFEQDRNNEGVLDIEELWSHSLATARISTWLVTRIKNNVRVSFTGTAAMLHDVGKLVLQRWRPVGFRRAISLSHERNTSLMHEEVKELGLSHALAGVLLLNRWHLPVTLSWVVKGCHLPVTSDDMPEPAMVYLAGQVARHMGIGIDGERSEDYIPDEVREILGVEQETVSDLVSEGFEDFVKSTLSDIKVKIK